MKFRILKSNNEFRIQRKWLNLFWRDCYFSTGGFYHSEQRVHAGHDTVTSYIAAERRVIELAYTLKHKRKNKNNWQTVFYGDL